MSILLSIGLIFTLLAAFFILFKWGNEECHGIYKVAPFTFVAILFTSGLDVGLIMFPLTEFPVYADTAANPEYAFSNPLSIEFGFWGFLIWTFYFLTAAYFSIIEPKVRFFELPVVKFINNAVIIGTCAFTAYLLLINLPWYIPQIGDGETIAPAFYVIVFGTIVIATLSSTDIKYVRILSLSSTYLFLALILFMWVGSSIGLGGLFSNLGLLVSGYFPKIHKFVLPLNDYHEFYLFWWFAWSIMIGQFVSRFTAGIKVYKLIIYMLIVPSIPLALWFSVVYGYYIAGITTEGLFAIAMISVGIIFVINSLDSLIRLYTTNLDLTVEKLGKNKYIIANIVALSAFTLLYKLDFLQIQWVGAVVILIYFACFAYILKKQPTIKKEEAVQ